VWPGLDDALLWSFCGWPPVTQGVLGIEMGQALVREGKM